MTPDSDVWCGSISFTNHAVERFGQRFPELASESQLLEVVGRAQVVPWRRLQAEARHCGRPLRVTHDNVLLRDDQTGCLFVCREVGNMGQRNLLVRTVVRFRRPTDFEWLE